MLPIVECLAGARTDAERADVVLRLPDFVLSSDDGFKSVCRLLGDANFHVGIECVGILRVALHAVRTCSGDLPAPIAETQAQAKSVLLAVARGDAGNAATRQ